MPICIVLLVTGEHYVFFSLERIGYKNQSFNIWKFATMTKNSPNMAGGLHTVRKDPCILPMGGGPPKDKNQRTAPADQYPDRRYEHHRSQTPG